MGNDMVTSTTLRFNKDNSYERQRHFALIRPICSLCLEEGSQFVGRILLHRGQDVCIDPQGNFDALMPKPFLHHMHGDTRL